MTSSSAAADGDRLVDRIGKLLAQAEGTDNEHEAAAFVEKAQQLATEHAVDLELARARQRSRTRVTEALEQERVEVGPRGKRGNRHRVLLYVVIAHANDVQVDVASDSTWVLGFGHRSDLDVVERLWSSLAVQMAVAAQRRLDAGEHRRSRLAASSWRLSFYDGYVAEVGARLQAARDRVVEQAVQVPQTGISTELVLREKGKRVQDFHRAQSQARGSWRGTATGRTAVSEAARSAGRADGRRADRGAPRVEERRRLA